MNSSALATAVAGSPVFGALNRIWRIFATALSFSLFGIGGLILGLLVFPLMALLSPNPAVLRRRAQYTVHLSFRLFLEFMCRVGVMSYSIDGLERLRKPGQLIIANHPSLIDVVALIAFLPDSCCVVKGALTRNPFTRGPVRAAGYVLNLDSVDFIDQCCEVLARGQSLVIFPEGTRSTPGVRPSLRRGTANIALRSGCPLRPVIIHCEPSTLTKGLPWYAVPKSRFHVSLRVDPEITVRPYLEAHANTSRAARQLTSDLQDYLWREGQGARPAAKIN